MDAGLKHRTAIEPIVLKSLDYAVSSSFRKIFNVSWNKIVYLCRYTFNCSNMEDILCIRNFLQKYCSLENIVGALCRHKADIELATVFSLFLHL